MIVLLLLLLLLVVVVVVVVLMVMVMVVVVVMMVLMAGSVWVRVMEFELVPLLASSLSSGARAAHWQNLLSVLSGGRETACRRAILSCGFVMCVGACC